MFSISTNFQDKKITLHFFLYSSVAHVFLLAGNMLRWVEFFYLAMWKMFIFVFNKANSLCLGKSPVCAHEKKK